MESYDFSGWATRNNLRCSDGRTILKDAFKGNNGQTVPLVWNHQHNDPLNVLGHALLENRDNGVYAYCKFNDTEAGRNAKLLVEHGDVSALSIYANQLKQQGANVLHGAIREVSLVLAGANPGAFIDAIMQHGEESEEEAIIYTGEEIDISHSECKPDDKKKKKDPEASEEEPEEEPKDDSEKEPEPDSEKEPEKSEESEESEEDSEDDKKKKKVLEHSDEPNKEEDNMAEEENEKTVKDVVDSMNEEQKTVMYALIGQALEDAGVDGESEGGNEDMKHNVFDQDEMNEENVLTHSDEATILNMAKTNSVGSLQDAIGIYCAENASLAHGIDDIESLFPDYKDVYPGAPEMITRDQGWVSTVMEKTHKSPISRIRTRQADVRGEDLNAFGYKKGDKKKVAGNIKLLKRTTDPQTVYRKDALHRDDIIDITDFDVVEYQYSLMKMNLNEELAKAIMIGDGREDGDENKIGEEHIRPIWTDDELYTIHADVDVAAARKELQGTDTDAHFGDNYVYAEAIITAALYSREKYKGSGSLDFFCTPHLLNVMLLARDLNGRRIYNSVSDIAAALNVSAIHTAEQFEGKTRTTDDGDKNLLGIFVNLADYQIGSTKGGEITRFNQFDIDFNQEKYLIETRLSGALTRVYSAIVLEEPVAKEVVTTPAEG